VVVTGFFGTLSLYDTPTNEMRSAADAILQRVGLSRVRDHRYSTLSSGERVRALVGRALVHRPPVLLLDEPTAGLDLRSREQVLGTIQRLVSAPGNQTTVVLVTHHVEELPPITSRVLLLGDGRVAAEGAPREVLQSDILSGVYGCRVVVRHSHGRFSLHVAPDAWDELLEDPSHPDGPEGNTSDSSAPSA
jgi:iron complex transport system ATP-binding protein